MLADRSLEGVALHGWIIIAVYLFAGWSMANLKTAVGFIDGTAEVRAGIIADALASVVAGFSVFFYLLGETKFALLWCYIGATVGSYGGKKLVDAAVAGFTSLLGSMISRGK